MFNLNGNLSAVVFILVNSLAVNVCGSLNGNYPTNEAPANQIVSTYSWTQVIENAAYPRGYNYPVFVAKNRIWAFHNDGIWHSTDAKHWTKANLPQVRRNPYQARYVQFKDAVYALGQNQGNYIDGIKFSSIIRRTTDYERWEVLAGRTNLPDRVFYGSVVFDGKIWLFGGFDGKNYYNDIWNSSDGVKWTRALTEAEWSPRNIANVVVFKNRVWIIGGGVIDGETTNNPKSNDEIWSSADGIKWKLETDKSSISFLGTPIVFDGKLWLVGANRDRNFARSSLVTTDGVTWRQDSAPWSPRGLVAAWVFDNKLFITDGKYSVTENGETKFIYTNDVWSMAAASIK